MNTSGLLAEIIVIGLTSFVWIGILVMKIFGMDIGELPLDHIEKFSTPLTFFLIGFAYTIGWVTRCIADFIIKITFRDKLRDEIFGPQSDYNKIKTSILLKAPDRFLDAIAIDQNVIRLTSSSALNLFLVGLSTYFMWGAFWPSFCIVSISGITFLLTYTRYRYYYNRMLNCQKLLETN